MYKKNDTVAVRIGMKKINGVPTRTVSIMKKPTPRDFARAVATMNDKQGRNNFGPWDDEKDISEMSDEEYYASLGQNSGIGNYGQSARSISDMSDEEYYQSIGKGTTYPPGDSRNKTASTSKPKWLDVLAQNAGAFLNAGKSDKSAGKGVGNILAGLGEDYIQDCVRRYKAGESMSEFDRRVAMAAIEIEKKAKNYGKQKIGEWIGEHLPEIGLGVLGLIVIVTFVVKR